MSWEAYTKIRLQHLVKGEKYLPRQKDILCKLLSDGQIWKEEDLISHLHKKTDIDMASIRENIDRVMNTLIENGVVYKVSPGYYRAK